MKHTIKQFLINQFYPISLYARQIAGTIVILFLGRYLCKSKNPGCDKCGLKDFCKFGKNYEKNS